MSTLDNLPNPTSRIPVLNAAGSYSAFLKSGPVDNDVNWDPALQYYIGDMVRSTIDGALYVYQGGALAAPPASPPNQATGPIVTKRGGVDPALDAYDAGGQWVPCAPVSGLIDSIAPVVASGGGGAWAVTGGTVNLPPVPGATYLAIVQGVANKGSAMANGEFSQVILTPSGTGAVAVQFQALPAVGSNQVAFTGSLVFSTGTGAAPFTVILSGNTGGGTFIATTLKLTVVRLA